MSEVKEQTEVFSFIGNYLCLDFANTVDDRIDDIPQDRFRSYSDLVVWSQAAGIMTSDEAQLLIEEAQRRPAEAAHVLQETLGLREVIYRIFSALAIERSPEPADLQKLNMAFAEAMSHACITQHDDHFTWDWQQKGIAFERIRWAVVRSAAELLISEELHLTRQCSSDTCTWLFLDASKNHSRRWCDMKSCGNRTKVGRHYERKKQKDPEK